MRKWRLAVESKAGNPCAMDRHSLTHGIPAAIANVPVQVQLLSTVESIQKSEQGF